MYVFVSDDHMLDWHSCQICDPLEIKLLLLLLLSLLLLQYRRVFYLGFTARPDYFHMQPFVSWVYLYLKTAAAENTLFLMGK